MVAEFVRDWRKTESQLADDADKLLRIKRAQSLRQLKKPMTPRVTKGPAEVNKLGSTERVTLTTRKTMSPPRAKDNV